MLNMLIELCLCVGPSCTIKYFHASNDQLIHAGDRTGYTAITLACGEADLKTVELLIELGADMNQICMFGQNGFMLAVMRGTVGFI